MTAIRLSAFLCLLLLLSSLCFGESPSGADADKLKAIQKRVFEGDSQALLEVTSLPAEVAIPFLDKFLEANKRESDRFQAAKEALLSFPNWDDFYSRRLPANGASNWVDEDAFSVLSKIDTEKAAKLLAPYLFNFNLQEGRGDAFSSTPGVSAALALGRMTISNRPKETPPGEYTGKEIVEWQKWAIENGLVPQTTKVAVPQWLIDLETPSQPPQTTSASQEATSATPLTTSTPISKNKVAPTPTVATERQSPSGFPIVAFAILAAIVIGVIVFVVRRKSP